MTDTQISDVAEPGDLKDSAAAAASSASATKPRRKRRVRRKPVKKSTIWLHRWLSLILGVFLIVETTTGAILLYAPELRRHIHSQSLVTHEVDKSKAISLQDAMAVVKKDVPGFKPGYVYWERGTIVVVNTDYDTFKTVDPTAGTIIGGWKGEDDHKGVLGWVIGASENIHLCALSCEDHPLYVSWLADEIPGSQWLGFEDDGTEYKITWGGLILGVLAVMLLFLALSGIWLWWPTIKHFKRGVRIRRGGNRYARDYDIHQVFGMITVPFLLMWGLTGMSYEFGFTQDAWYGALPGDELPETTLVSKTKTGPEIGWDAAVAAAQKRMHTTDRPVWLDGAPDDDKTAPYSVWFSDGYDPWAGAGSGGGDLQVLVDRHDAKRTAIAYGNNDQSVASMLYSDYNYPIHAGTAVNGWWRIVWFVMGMLPLLLAWTGVSTWLFKRSVRKRRKKAELARQQAERERQQADLAGSDVSGPPGGGTLTLTKQVTATDDSRVDDR